MIRFGRRVGAIVAILFLCLVSAAAETPGQNREERAQNRPAGSRVPVPPDRIRVDDGDTIEIEWPEGDREVVRILGIDTPEIQHVAHNLPFDQPFGREARGFASGAFAAAAQIEILRASMKDPYGRTLGYLFLNGQNYSVLVLRAGLAEESVTRFGDNGFPEEAASCLAASKEAGPLAFESPHAFRGRMRDVARSMQERGLLPRPGR